MKNLNNIISAYLLDLRYVTGQAVRALKRYLVNLGDALLGRVSNKYTDIRAGLTADIMKLVAENYNLRTEVDKLTKKVGKKTAAVAKKAPVKKAAPAKKKTSGK
jgi:regulator of replication initiation timing